MTDTPGARFRTQLLHRLAQLRRRRLAIDAGRTLATTLTLVFATGAVLVWLEAALYLPSAWRFTLLAAAALLSLILPGLQQFRRMRGQLSLHGVAIDVERRVPELAQRLLTALELGNADAAMRRAYSAQLLEAATREAAHVLSSLPNAQLVPIDAARRAFGRFLAVALIVSLGQLAAGDVTDGALNRVLHPGRSYSRPVATYLRIDPAQTEVVRGDDAVIFVHLAGVIPTTLRIFRHETSATSAPPGEDTSEEIVLRRDIVPGDSIAYTFESVQRAFAIHVEGGDGRAGPVLIDVLDPPAVSRLRLAYEYPAHTELPARIEQEGGDIRALAGTLVRFDITATKPLSRATLVLDDTLRLPAETVDNRAHVSWRLPTPDAERDALRQYRIELIDTKGVSNRDPIRYALKILLDGDPSVAIPVPGRDTDLHESQQVSVEVEAVDDFGLSRLSLVFRINDGPTERIQLVPSVGRQVHIRHLWDLSSRHLLPEDRVTYHAEVFDNDAIDGPKSGVSEEFTLRLPSLYELFGEANEEQAQHLQALEELAEQEAEALQTVEQMRREILRTEELTWEQRQQLESTLAAEEQRAEQVQELAQEMAEAMEQLEEGGLTSDAMMEKMEEIRDLMAAVTSPEMLEALQSLQQAMDEPDPEQLAEALRQFTQDQEAFQQRLERTLALLRQVRAEQRLLAAVAQAEDLAERQSTINEDLDSADLDESPPGSKDSSRLQEQEASLARDTDRLQEELETLSNDFSDLDEQSAQNLAEQAKLMEQKGLSSRMQQMEQSIQEHAGKKARQQGEGLESDLSQLSQILKNLQAQFEGGQRQQMGQELRAAMAGLLHLSQQQEALSAQMPRLQGDSLTELATGQQALARGVELVVEQIGKVSRKTMAVEAGLATTIGYALMGMETAAEHLSQRQGSRALEEADRAMGHLNEAVMQLRQSADNLQQASTPSAFGQAMEKMMGLSQQQMALNEATQKALQDGAEPGQQGGRKPGQDGLPRLADQQRRIYRALGELQKSLRGQRSMESLMDAIRKDMEQVLARLQRNAADPLVRQGQQQVLQRMLDASRSIRNRGFEKRRRSATATQQLYTGPEWLPVNLGQQPDALANAMRRALAGDYPAEYRQLIRRYYETVYEDLHGTSGSGVLP